MTGTLEISEPESLEIQQPSSQFSPLHLILHHYLLLVLGAIVGCAIGALYYARATPVYESSTQILVVSKSPNTLPAPSSAGGSSQDIETPGSDIATQQILIRSPAVVSAAVRQGNLARLPSFAGSDPTNAIISSLKIGQEKIENTPTNILKVSVRGTHAEDLPIILTAVVESYQQFLRNRYQNVADETAKLIVEANKILEQKLERKQKEYGAFLVQLPTSLWRGKDGFNSVQLQLMSLEAKRVDLLNREAELQGRLQALDKAMKDGRHSRAELLTMIGQGTTGGLKETSNFQNTDRLMALKLQEKYLMEDYGPDHPEVRMVRDQLALLSGRVKLSDQDSKNEEDTDPVESHVRALKLELEYIRIATETLGKLLEKAHREAKPLRALEIQNESYRTDIARSQQLFDAIAKRLDEISILKDANNGYEIETINPPGVGMKVAPKPLAVFASALLLGLLAGFGLAYLAEITDQSFRTPEEIRRRLGLPVVGHIPLLPPEDKEKLQVTESPLINPILCTAHRPKSREAEAYRGVRTALLFSRQGGHSVVQVTSPDMGDGKSTLIANLGVSIAQAEKKVILIDCDFRRPRLHKLFNLSADQGLASVMIGEAELNDVIQTTPIPGLSVLPCGPISPNPAELLSLPRFRELLTYLREKYDFVLVDTPPLLAVTDPCVVAPYVDGVLLTIRISKNARPHALRAKEILSTLGARVIGVVVNGVGMQAKGYGYDSYRYGYYNYYYYSYTYRDYYSSDTEGPGTAPAQTDRAADTPKKEPSRASGKKPGFFTWLFKR